MLLTQQSLYADLNRAAADCFPRALGTFLEAPESVAATYIVGLRCAPKAKSAILAHACLRSV